MSISSKHIYRFKYLKSVSWKTVRLEALTREKGKCQICAEESIYNDAHHIWYPDNIYDTTEKHLVVLCRPCHDFVHTMLPDCKTKDEEYGRAQWIKFRNAVENWRLSKRFLFEVPTSGFSKMRELGQAYDALKKKHDALLGKLSAKSIRENGELTTDQEYDILRSIIKKWRNEKKILTDSSQCANGSDSCVISTPRNDSASL